jgi:sugar lactone lactonase YvrE
MTIEPRLIWPVDALLGEGPAWFAEEAALRFVDIKGGRLHRHNHDGAPPETIELGGQPSFVVPAEDGGLVIGSGDRILHIGKDGTERALLARVPMPAHNRTNDATVDAQGRLWFGTMDDEEIRPTGALWCLDRGELHPMGGDAVVTNGPAITRDCRYLYHVDSGSRTIWRFTIGPGPRVEPRVEHREVFIQLGEADGHPDGIVLDSEDCLWVALWDGWAVRRYAPDGRLLLTIPMPCARVTKIAFGGPDLRTAYVTTARVGLDETQLASQPHAGHLFAFAAPVAGCILPQVRLSAASAE